MTMNLRNERVLASFTLVSFLLANAAALLHDHHHSCGSGSVCQEHIAEQHCCDELAVPHHHRPDGDSRPAPADHDDCPICKYLSTKSLSPAPVTVAQQVEQVSTVEPIPFAPPYVAPRSRTDCRGPPSLG